MSSSTDEMKININPTRASQLLENLTAIQSRISQTLSSHPHLQSRPTPRLVAVSKLKPASDILALHNSSAAQLHFGENYVQELLEKSCLLPETIRWHFIGSLQSNKAAQLAREVKGLWAVESVDSVKKAGLLDKGRGESGKGESDTSAANQREPLRVFVQINTSGEESKAGVEPEGKEVVEICRFVRDECANLKLQGFMTIGAIARSVATTAENENEDFDCLRRVKDRVAGELGLKVDELDLSMGMSEDFEGAIVQGSDEVRIGSTIFGERPPKKEAKVLE